jgi:hypothetical protein
MKITKSNIHNTLWLTQANTVVICVHIKTGRYSQYCLLPINSPKFSIWQMSELSLSTIKRIIQEDNWKYLGTVDELDLESFIDEKCIC